MKNNVLKISILPLVLLVALSFTGIPPQKEKGHKNENSQGKESRNDHGNNNNKSGNSSQGNNDKGRADDNRSESDKGRYENHEQGNAKNGQGKDKHENNGKSGDRQGDSDHNKDAHKNNNKNKSNGKSHREIIQWDRAENINWGFENYSSRKRPKDHKKVTICHNTGNSELPVNISVSENALKAHMNHGDQVGNCTTNYSDRWSDNYIRTRENVYNNYENTWETMSYSESLLRFAADRLLGIKSSFQVQRPTLSVQEIQRKEALILDLQNNVNSLQNQLAVTRQRTDGVNININL